MKNLKEYIVEASFATKIKSMAKYFMNDLRTIFGAEEKTYRPYIVIDKDDNWAENKYYIWTKEAEYLFQRMKDFLDNSTDYTTRKTDNKNEDKATVIEYSYSDMDTNEVRTKVWNKLCELISEVNDELGTGDVDFTNVPDFSKISTKNKQLTLFPEQHKKYQMDRGENGDRFNNWEWCRIEMQTDENNDSSYVEHGYYFYPGAMFCY